VIFISKRGTPLVGSDAMSILDVSADEYRSALADGRLRRSIRVDNDPTGRLAFHSFWDLLEFSLAGRDDVVSGSDEERRRLAAELSDDLAGDDEDVVGSTGNFLTDLAIVTPEWADETSVRDVPANVVSCYARLLQRTLRHVCGVAEAALRGHGGLHRSGEDDIVAAPGTTEAFMGQAVA
jgi:hypothetical protein